MDVCLSMVLEDEEKSENRVKKKEEQEEEEEEEEDDYAHQHNTHAERAADLPGRCTVNYVNSATVDPV